MLIGLLASCGDKIRFKSSIKCDDVDALDYYQLWDDGNEGELSNYTGIIKWCVNGYIQTTCEYKNGKKDGLCIGYGPNGVTHEVPFKNGRKDGLGKSYVNGILSATSEWKDGGKHGSQKQYYQNGQVKIEYIMKNGGPSGEGSVCWDEDGNQIECERTAEEMNNEIRH